jgi:hypothetical protein
MFDGDTLAAGDPDSGSETSFDIVDVRWEAG